MENIKNITAEQVDEAIKEAKKFGYCKNVRLKGRNSTRAVYLRYASELTGLLADRLPHTTLYVGGSRGARGRTMTIFERDTIRVILHLLGLDSERYAKIAPVPEWQRNRYLWQLDSQAAALRPVIWPVQQIFNNTPDKFDPVVREFLEDIMTSLDRRWPAGILADWLEENGFPELAKPIHDVLKTLKDPE